MHASVAFAGASAVFYVWRKADNLNLRGSILMTATLLVSPHIGLYDLTWLAYPMAWMFIELNHQHPAPSQLRFLAWIWGLFLSLMILGVSIGFYWISILVFLFVIFIVIRSIQQRYIEIRVTPQSEKDGQQTWARKQSRTHQHGTAGA